jgi:hypothetical protein
LINNNTEEIFMETRKIRTVNILVVVLFALSALIGFALMFIAVWGDVEASMFDVTYNGEKNLGTLSCPVLITPQDTGEFSAKISNPIDRTVKTSVRVHVSAGFLTMIREENEKFDLAPDESRKLAWSVDPDDATYGKMVLVRLFLFPNHPIPSKDATCGIYVLDIPFFTGKQITIASLLLSSVGMVAATSSWAYNNKPLGKKRREVLRTFSILTGIIIIGAIASVLGWWLVGSIGIVAAILMTFGSITEMLK